MKLNLLLRWIFPWFAVLFAWPPQTAAAEEPRGLKVQVNLPSWSLPLDERMAETLTARVRDAFYRAGFPQRIETVRPVEDPTKLPWLLSLDFIDWKFGELGRIECTFKATLRTPHGSRDLGTFSDQALERVGPQDRWGLPEAFVEADGAITALCEAAARSQLLPGFGPQDISSASRPNSHSKNANS
jgi:hypothetical protein